MNKNHLSFECYSKIRPFFDGLIRNNDLSGENMSSFWREYLDSRYNFPSFNDMTVFRRSMAWGIGYNKNTSEKSESGLFQSDFGRAVCNIPFEFLANNQESSVGLPYQFFKNGILSSPAGLHNCVNAYYVLRALNTMKSPSPKTILEIGAGYGGMAEILLRNLKPSRYIICDLPQNLFLSAYYLSVNFPHYSIVMVNTADPGQIPENTLVFCTPAGLDRIKQSFDLAVNTYSFQEMTLPEVNRYFTYISNHITDDGLFYFLNSHGAAGAVKPGDYPFEMFTIAKWGPMTPAQTRFLHRKQHVESFLQKRKGESYPVLFKDMSHILSLLMFMGINNNIADMCDRLVKNKLTTDDCAFLEEVNTLLFCNTPDSAVNRCGLKHPDHVEQACIILYIRALLFFFSRDYQSSVSCFEKAISMGLQGLALSRSQVAMGLICGHTGKTTDAREYFQRAIDSMPQFENELMNPELSNINIATFTKSYKFAFPNLKLDHDPGWKSILKKIRKRLISDK